MATQTAKTDSQGSEVPVVQYDLFQPDDLAHLEKLMVARNKAAKGIGAWDRALSKLVDDHPFAMSRLSKVVGQLHQSLVDQLVEHAD